MFQFFRTKVKSILFWRKIGFHNPKKFETSKNNYYEELSKHYCFLLGRDQDCPLTCFLPNKAKCECFLMAHRQII